MHRRNKLACLESFLCKHQLDTLHMLQNKFVIVQKPRHIEERSIYDDDKIKKCSLLSKKVYFTR